MNIYEKRKCENTLCPASSGKEKTKCGWIAPRTHSDGPRVSDLLAYDFKRRELTTRLRNPR